ncbi:hypothetical protein SCLCIDRAFT_616938 [Scleroderma citrinum Foug A]|uniref:Uncharacterized protein n=1 Tax=Scleroderma citrinum Foug A TaxID=1036808 RepID=A0A0C3D6K5_9AGAM|nr:hypothetical protein SCLCIDRAFT_616938 [Scleroderma citrinum Foug A]
MRIQLGTTLVPAVQLQNGAGAPCVAGAPVSSTLHLIQPQYAILRFSWRKQEIRHSYHVHNESFHRFKMYSIYAGEQCLEYLGDMLCVVLGLPEDWNNHARVWLIPHIALVHLDEPTR